MSVAVVIPREALPDERMMRILGDSLIQPNGCLYFSGAHGTHGYAMVEYRRKKVRLHRAMYHFLRGLEPRHLHHVCGIRRCINPFHLEPVELSDHMRLHQPWEIWQRLARSKTHCSQGHEFTPENVYMHPQRGRECRLCKKVRARHHYSRSREKNA